MDMICDFDYWNTVINKRRQKNYAMKDMFPLQMKNRAFGTTKKVYAKRIIRDIILTFLDVIINEMIHNSYVWIMPRGLIKILVAAVNKFKKNTPLKYIIQERFFMKMRVVYDGVITYGNYNIVLDKFYQKQINRKIVDGYKYPLLKIV